MKDLLDKKIDDLNYEDAFDRLQRITELLENGDVSLDDSIKYYEQGILLKNFCEKNSHLVESKSVALLSFLLKVEALPLQN